jgi:hypothetical protein
VRKDADAYENIGRFTVVAEARPLGELWGGVWILEPRARKRTSASFRRCGLTGCFGLLAKRKAQL